MVIDDTTKTTKRQNVIDMFVDGARRGFTIAINNVIPYVLMAFVIIRFLDLTGILNMIGKVFAPVMALWGLPGEAAVVLMASFMSMGGGVGVAVSLYTAHHLNAVDVTVLMPAIYLMGNPVQNIGRILGIAEVNKRYYTVITVISILISLLSMWVMLIILMFFK